MNETLPRKRKHSEIVSVIDSTQASPNTKIHCLYGYFHLGFSVELLTMIYRKSKSTIYNWIARWNELNTTERILTVSIAKKFNEEKKSFLIKLFDQNPTLFLDEARHKFICEFKMNISISSVWTIIKNAVIPSSKFYFYQMLYLHQILCFKKIQLFQPIIICHQLL